MYGEIDILTKLNMLRSFRSPAVDQVSCDELYNEVYNYIVGLSIDKESYQKTANDLAERVCRLEKSLEELVHEYKIQERLLCQAWKYIPDPNKCEEYEQLDRDINKAVNGEEGEKFSDRDRYAVEVFNVR